MRDGESLKSRLDFTSHIHLQPNYTKIAEYCNLWRNYNDIQVHVRYVELSALLCVYYSMYPESL